MKVIREFDWHHISLIVDETDIANTLVRHSIEKVFKEVEFGHEIYLDIQSFSRSNNRVVNYTKVLQMSSRSARSELTFFVSLNDDIK